MVHDQNVQWNSDEIVYNGFPTLYTMDFLHSAGLYFQWHGINNKKDMGGVLFLQN